MLRWDWGSRVEDIFHSSEQALNKENVGNTWFRAIAMMAKWDFYALTKGTDFLNIKATTGEGALASVSQY